MGIVKPEESDKNQSQWTWIIAILGSSTERVATPSFNPASGNQTSNGNITLSTTTSDAIIYYTTDGTEPTTSSTHYAAPISNIWSLAGKNIQAIAVKSGLTNSTVLSGVFSLPPLKTGQTTVFAAGDNGTNQSGINRGYTDNGNGTVTDHATGLVWQKCTKGSNTATDCSGVITGDTSNWADAGTYCSNLDLGGLTNWRLPSRQELETILDFSRSNPAVDTAVFPATFAGGFYWSSTTFPPNTNIAWGIIFDVGNIFDIFKTITGYVRCVSGSSKEFSSSFTDNSDGTIRDDATGLVWQKCSRGQNNDGTCSGTATTASWFTAVSDCSLLSLASRTWRLPTVNELKTLVDTTKATGAIIDTDFFPATVSCFYWSSTTYLPSTTNAWNPSFNTTGTVVNGSKSVPNYVRCVSGP